LTGLDYSVLQINSKIVSSHTDDSKPVKQEVNSTVILPLSVFPGQNISYEGKKVYKIFICPLIRIAAALCYQDDFGVSLGKYCKYFCGRKVKIFVKS
jgi:hypothetical protein